jgi:hypothetical protein
LNFACCRLAIYEFKNRRKTAKMSEIRRMRAKNPE